MTDWLAPYDRRAERFPGPITPADHPVFRQFPLGHRFKPGGFDVDFVGQLTDVKFVRDFDDAARREPGDRYTVYPAASCDETFEWICLLEAVLEAPRGGTFTVIELGAGYGRWLATAACAARARRPDLRMRLVGVEAEPTHFGWMHEHFRNNQLDPAEHRLIQAAVLAESGQTQFWIGFPADWYGQSVVGDPNAHIVDFPAAKVVSVPAVGIVDLLREYDAVDLIDMDIQGAEAEVVPAGIEEMTRRVRRAFIETHSSDIHAAVGRTMTAAGWRCEAAYDGLKTHPTVFGDVHFNGGVSYWVNPSAGGRLVRLVRRAAARLGMRPW